MIRHFVLSSLSCAALAAGASASITSSSANVIQIAQPANAQLNVLPSTPNAFAWNEAQNFLLTQGLTVNAMAAGTYNANGDLSNSVIPTGTRVNSHYIHFDSPGSTSATLLNGSVTFDADIIGVICINTTGTTRWLDDSDYLGAPTLFTHGENARGLEFGANTDNFTISANLRTIGFNFSITQPGDFIRVITMVPTPGAAALGACGFLVMGRRRR